jgi:hypothetical protein
MQDPVAVGAEGDALLLCLADRGGDVTVPNCKIINRAFVLADDVVEVDDRRVGETAMGTSLLFAVGFPADPFASFTFGGSDLNLVFVGDVPAPRVLPLPFAPDLLVLERHLELLFPVQGSCKGVEDGGRVEPEAASDEVIGAWFVVRGV